MKLVLALVAVTLPSITVLCGCGSSVAPPPSPSPDFTVSATPQSLFVPVGVGGGSLQISIQALNGFSQPVSITLQGLPSGVTSAPAPPFIMNAGTPQTVTFSAASDVSIGVQNITVQGTQGSLTHSGTFNLSVAAPVYAYIAGGSVVAGYAVDANSGTVTTLPGLPVTLPDYSIDLVAASESGGTFLYVLNEASGSPRAQTLSGYRIDPASGALSLVRSINYQPDIEQRSLTVHPSGKFLYIVPWSPNCVLAYLIDPATGNLTQSSCSTPSPDIPFVIAPPGNFAYGTGGTSLELYSVNPNDGSLTQLQSFNSSKHTVILTTDVAGHVLYDLAFPPITSACVEMLIWSIDPNTGALTQLTTSFAPPQCLPLSMSFDPGGQFVYVTSTDIWKGWAQATGAAIYGGATDPTTGNLTNVPGSPFATQDAPLFGIVEPTQGKFLIELLGSVGGSTFSIGSYPINPGTGALSEVSKSAAAVSGEFPLKMVIVQPAY